MLEQADIPEFRILRDQLYPVKVSNANRTAILDEHENVLQGAEEALEQENDVPVSNPNATVSLVKVGDGMMLVAPVYIPSNNRVTSWETITQLRGLRRQVGHNTDYLVIGDFNLHDQVLGGDGVSQARQGEADYLINLINELSLMRLLPRGTKRWQRDR